MNSTQRLVKWVRTVLVIGIILSASIILIGGILYLHKHGHETVGSDFSIFHGEPKEMRSIIDIFIYSRQLNSQGIIQLGILLLIVTPLARVAISLLSFIRSKDWIYIFATAYVFAVLLYSLIK